jgi:hypothetical protein
MKTSKNTLIVFCCITLIVLIGACKKNKQERSTVIAGGGVQQFSSYPFGIGREWHYNTTLTIYANDTTVYNYVKVYEHLSDTIINGITCHKVGISNSQSASNVYTQYCYYANMSDGLHVIANVGNAGGFTWLRNKLLANLKSPIHEPGLGIEQVDSIYLLSTALHLTKLPVVYGQEWYSNEYGPQFNNKRKWLSPSTVNISLGTFNCAKLQFITGVGNPATFRVYQHFGSKGLIKVEMQQDSLIFSSSNIGHSISTSELSYVNF